MRDSIFGSFLVDFVVPFCWTMYMDGTVVRSTCCFHFCCLQLGDVLRRQRMIVHSDMVYVDVVLISFLGRVAHN